MLEVHAFGGLRFDGSRVDFNEVVTPPFDVISPTERSVLAALSPYNMVHLILPETAEGGDKYAAAAGHLAAWRAEGVLRQDSEPGYYYLEQRFRDDHGRERLRRAFYGLVKIPEDGEETVLGHERTFPHKIQDRLALTRATHTQFGGIFVLYDDPEHVVMEALSSGRNETADVAAQTIDGAEQSLWRVPANDVVADFFRDKHLYIADGHHRFATARAYRDEQRAKGAAPGGPWEYVMFGFVALDDPGLLIYPAHRVISLPESVSGTTLREKLAPYFDVAPARNGLMQEVKDSAGCAIGLVLKDEKFVLRLKDMDRAAFLGADHGPAWRDLDVSVLHRGIFEKVLGLGADAELVYEPQADRAVAYCERGEKDACFLLKGVTPEQLRACAEAREFMPQKATYLYPKLPTGAVFYTHE